MTGWRRNAAIGLSPVDAKGKKMSGNGDIDFRAARQTFLAAMLGLLGISFSFPASALPRYTILDLGTLGGDSSSAGDINQSGQVAGSSVNSNGKTRAFRYTDGVGMVDLGVAPSFLANDTSFGTSINDAGQVVGSSKSVARDSGTVAFRYTDGVGMENLTDSHCPGLYVCLGSAADINSIGQVVGWEYKSIDTEAVIYTDGKDIGYFGMVSGDDDSQAAAINDHGQVAGWSSREPFNTDLYRHAWRYTTGLGLEFLGTLGGSISVSGSQNSFGHPVSMSNSINESGSVVGSSSTTSLRWHGFLYTDADKMQDLGVLAGDDSSSGVDINDDGIVVGTSWNTGGGFNHPVLWTRPGCPEDLNSAEGIKNSGWILSSVNGINNKGQIVGTGKNPAGKSHAFRLTPVGDAGVPQCSANPSPNPTPNPTPTPGPSPTPTPTPTPTPNPNPTPGPGPASGGSLNTIAPEQWTVVRPSAPCVGAVCQKSLTKYGRQLRAKALKAVGLRRAADKARARADQAGPDQLAKAQAKANRKAQKAQKATEKFDQMVIVIQALHD